MKSNTFFQIMFFLLLIYLVVGCEPSYKRDAPGIALYKTRGDYFELVTVGVQDSQITRTWSYNQDRYKFVISKKDTTFRFRFRMANGFVLDAEANLITDAFLNLTHKQYMKKETTYQGNQIPSDTLKNHIIDLDPYAIFYRDEDQKKFPFTEIEEIDTAEINKIIKENKIDQFFKQLK